MVSDRLRGEEKERQDTGDCHGWSVVTGGH